MKITKILIHYDGIINAPKEYFGYRFKGTTLSGCPSPIVTFELNKEVNPDEFKRSIESSTVSITTQDWDDLGGDPFYLEDHSGYTSIINQDELEECIEELSGAAIVPPKEINFSSGMDEYGYSIELSELIGLDNYSKNRVQNNESNTNDGKISDIEREEMLKLIDGSIYELEYADEKFKADRDIVLSAVNLWGGALQFADKKLKADREVVLAAVIQDGSSLEYADEKLKADYDVVLKAIDNDCEESSIQFADKKLLADKEFY